MGRHSAVGRCLDVLAVCLLVLGCGNSISRPDAGCPAGFCGPADGGSVRDGGAGSGDAGADAGTSPDAGVRDAGAADAGWHFGPIAEDAACSCGQRVGVRTQEGGPASLACSCFSIPRGAFDCNEDSDCVRFDATCVTCLRVPAIAINRIWEACLGEYRRQYCSRYAEWEASPRLCCNSCEAGTTDPDCFPRCVGNVCSVPAPGFNNCSLRRDPANAGYYDPHPYPQDGGPFAPCGN